MPLQSKNKEKLTDNRLRKIENRLRRIEILLLKNNSKDANTKKMLSKLQKEEKQIELEQDKLEKEEAQILKDMDNIENEEQWHVELQYNCKSKIMDDANIINCSKTHKNCELTYCPLWKK